MKNNNFIRTVKHMINFSSNSFVLISWFVTGIFDFINCSFISVFAVNITLQKLLSCDYSSYISIFILKISLLNLLFLVDYWENIALAPFKINSTKILTTLLWLELLPSRSDLVSIKLPFLMKSSHKVNPTIFQND